MSGYNKFFVQGIGHLRNEFIEYGIPFPLMNAWLDASVQLLEASPSLSDSGLAFGQLRLDLL